MTKMYAVNTQNSLKHGVIGRVIKNHIEENKQSQLSEIKNKNLNQLDTELYKVKDQIKNIQENIRENQNIYNKNQKIQHEIKQYITSSQQVEKNLLAQKSRLENQIKMVSNNTNTKGIKYKPFYEDKTMTTKVHVMVG